MKNPTPTEIISGYEAYQQHEKRDAMYKTALFLVDNFWNQPEKMADSIGVLLLTWNQAFHRYGIFDFDTLETCISGNLTLLSKYRNREITSLVPEDEVEIRLLFQQFLSALKISGGKKHGTTSPVGVSKALHLLAPAFFPLWDDKIARGYGYNHLNNPSDTYILFLNRMKNIAIELKWKIGEQNSNKTLLKLIDEYNYAKFTKQWI